MHEPFRINIRITMNIHTPFSSEGRASNAELLSAIFRKIQYVIRRRSCSAWKIIYFKSDRWLAIIQLREKALFANVCVLTEVIAGSISVTMTPSWDLVKDGWLMIVGWPFSESVHFSVWSELRIWVAFWLRDFLVCTWDLYLCDVWCIYNYFLNEIENWYV